MGTGIRRSRRPLLAQVLVAAVVAAGCGGQFPVGSGKASAFATESPPISASPPASVSAPSPAASAVVKPGDPVAALTGLPVEGLAEGGHDVVLRIGAEGFRVPDGESLFDVNGDRALTARPGQAGAHAVLVVRDLEGRVIREIDSGMHLPQTGIVRGDDVYFGGLDLGPEGDDLDAATDLGVWVAHGGAPPELVREGEGAGLAVYTEIERSPDGATVGVWRCGESCSTILLRPGDDPVEIAKPGLIALTNDVALLIGDFSEVVAYRTDDGTELWRATTVGYYDDRYATSDGERIVLTSVEPAPGGGSTDQLRVEVLDAATGEVRTTVLVSTAEMLLWPSASLSTDRYLALLEAVTPGPDDPRKTVHVVDLEAGVLLDDELNLGPVPET